MNSINRSTSCSQPGTVRRLFTEKEEVIKQLTFGLTSRDSYHFYTDWNEDFSQWKNNLLSISICHEFYYMTAPILTDDPPQSTVKKCLEQELKYAQMLPLLFDLQFCSSLLANSPWCSTLLKFNVYSCKCKLRGLFGLRTTSFRLHANTLSKLRSTVRRRSTHSIWWHS